jgi:DNA-binding MarR family transcriptional regulator
MVETTREPALEVLAALTRLMAYWSSAEVQDRISAPVGLGLTTSETSVLYLLGLHGGSCRPSELAAEARLSRPTASKVIARLQGAGLVERSTDPDDGRAQRVSLSPKGRTSVEGLVGVGVDLVSAAMADWSAADRAALAELAPRLVAELVGPIRLPTASAVEEVRTATVR